MQEGSCSSGGGEASSFRPDQLGQEILGIPCIPVIRLQTFVLIFTGAPASLSQLTSARGPLRHVSNERLKSQASFCSALSHYIALPRNALL